MTGKTNRFLKYLETAFKDAVTDAVSGYMTESGCYAAGMRSCVEVRAVTADRVRFRRVWVYSDGLFGTKIKWTVKVSADTLVDLSQTPGIRDTERVRNMDFFVSMKGDMAAGLAYAEVCGVCGWSEATERILRSLPDRLDGNLVPVLGRGDYRSCAEAVLRKFMPETLSSGQPVDARELAKACGFRVVERHFSTRGGVLGRAYLDNTKDRFCDPVSGEEVEEDVARGTIVVDTVRAGSLSPFSENATILHEIVHLLFHRLSHLLSVLVTGATPVVTLSRGAYGNGEFTEIHANGISPYLAVSYNLTVKKIDDLWHDSRTHADGKTARALWTLRSFADFCKVPVGTAKKYLAGVGYAVEGLDCWFDGHRLRDYFYKRGSLREDETYLITLSDAAEGVGITEKQRAFLSEGRYVYCENHLVRKLDTYLSPADGKKFDESGTFRMTDYALEHMDECCLVIKKVTAGNFRSERN